MVGEQVGVRVWLTTMAMAAWAREHGASASRHCGDRKGTTLLRNPPGTIFFNYKRVQQHLYLFKKGHLNVFENSPKIQSEIVGSFINILGASMNIFMIFGNA